MNILIASDKNTAKRTCIMDWGWKLHRSEPLRFRNFSNEIVDFVYANDPNKIAGLDSDTKVYFILDGIEQRQLDALSGIVSQYQVIRNAENS